MSVNDRELKEAASIMITSFQEMDLKNRAKEFIRQTDALHLWAHQDAYEAGIPIGKFGFLAELEKNHRFANFLNRDTLYIKEGRISAKHVSEFIKDSKLNQTMNILLSRDYEIMIAMDEFSASIYEKYTEFKRGYNKYVEFINLEENKRRKDLEEWDSLFSVNGEEGLVYTNCVASDYISQVANLHKKYYFSNTMKGNFKNAVECRDNINYFATMLEQECPDEGGDSFCEKYDVKCSVLKYVNTLVNFSTMVNQNYNKMMEVTPYLSAMELRFDQDALLGEIFSYENIVVPFL